MTLDFYPSVQKVLEDVRAMGPKGGSAFGHSAAMAFKYVASDPSMTSADVLFSTLDQIGDELLAEKPTMATIHNARALIVEKTRQDIDGMDLNTIKASIICRADLFVQHSRDAVDRLGEVGGNLVQEDQTIMMHSFSKSLMSVFQHARDAGKTFRVICTESRPLQESRLAVNLLNSWGIQVVLVLDAAMGSMVPEADWCIAGADSLGIDGSVANKMGTCQLAYSARHFGKPMYIATEILKLQRQTAEGYPIHLERRPASEVVDVAAEFEFPERVTIRNQFFDLTPPTHIQSFITEQGIMPPAAIGRAWDALEKAFDDVDVS